MTLKEKETYSKYPWMAFYQKNIRDSLWVPVILAFFLNYYIEAMARQGILSGMDFMVDKPLVFLYNMLIIFGTLSPGILFRRKVLVYLFISLIWMILGTVNGVILSNRMTPFTTKDLANWQDGLTIATNYLSKEALIASGVLLAFILIGVVLFWFKGPKSDKVPYRRVVALFLVIVFGTFGVSGLGIRAGLVDTYFGNLAYAYRDYGFPYCFINTWLNTGITKPPNYTEDYYQQIFTSEELGEDQVMVWPQEDDGKKHPNIIMVQLESFADPTWFEDVSFSQDPIPNFRKLKERYSNGMLVVPSVGAGTANTEFEVLSGISVKSFGPGEYPYKSILLETTLETVAYDLKSIGFNTHALHNHRGAFYGRNKVFAHLGFDTFTSLEYMNNVVKTPKNWARDQVLIHYIMDALESTEEEDFVYAISVEGHGAYPGNQILMDPEITVTEAPSEEQKWQYEYYANLLYSMDQFVGDLIQQLSRQGERAIVVFYGDHLPAIDFTEEDLTTGNLYATEYVIWSNYWLPKEEKTLHAYQLAAEVLGKVKIQQGTLMTYHQNHKEDPDYMQQLEQLAYDMLYGKRYVYGGINPFDPTPLAMGIYPVRIEEVVKIGKEYYIKGENFTPFSKISLHGEILETIYLGPTILGLLEEIDPEEAQDMKVSQVEKNREILSTTE